MTSTDSTEDHTPPALSSDTFEAHLSFMYLPLPTVFAKNPHAWLCETDTQFHLRNIAGW